MEKSHYFLLVLLLAFSLQVYSQDDPEEGTLTKGETVELINSNIIEPGFQGSNDVVQLNQAGNENTLVAVQQISGASTYVLTAYQTGDHNNGYVSQTGEGHETYLLQTGNFNHANMWSVGSKVLQTAKQEGDQNLINSYIENYSYSFRAAGIFQLGDHNRVQLQLSDHGTANSLSGIAIVQNGPGNSAELSLDHFEAPYLKVEQNGGAVVAITHSDFYFPTH